MERREKLPSRETEKDIESTESVSDCKMAQEMSSALCGKYKIYTLATFNICTSRSLKAHDPQRVLIISEPPNGYVVIVYVVRICKMLRYGFWLCSLI
jgi:hypothetical protein